MRLLFGQFRDKTGIPSRQSLGTPVSGYPVNCKHKFITPQIAIAYELDLRYSIVRSLPDELYMTVSRDGLAMVMHKEATKSKAVATLAQF